jgi:hypothetical protein
MSDDKRKLAAMLQTPVFPQTMHQKRPDAKTTAGSKAPKRDNIFSKSRDTREDRGTREMKTSHNDQTFHAR